MPTELFADAQGVPQPIQEAFQSNLVYPQEEDEIQLTFFPSFRKNEGGEKARTLLEIEYGVTDYFQLIAEWDGLVYDNPDQASALLGTGNLELGGQYSWMGLGDGNTHFSIGALVEIPTGPVDNGLTDGFLEWSPFLVLARDFPRWNRSQIFMELGYNLVSRVRTPDDDDDLEPASDSLYWNVGGFVPVGRWRGVLEINGSHNEWDGGDENEIYVTPGMIYKLAKELEIGVAGPIGVTDSADDYRVIGYLMWEFELDELGGGRTFTGEFIAEKQLYGLLHGTQPTPREIF